MALKTISNQAGAGFPGCGTWDLAAPKRISAAVNAATLGFIGNKNLQTRHLHRVYNNILKYKSLYFS